MQKNVLPTNASAAQAQSGKSLILMTVLSKNLSAQKLNESGRKPTSHNPSPGPKQPLIEAGAGLRSSRAAQLAGANTGSNLNA